MRDFHSAAILAIECGRMTHEATTNMVQNLYWLLHRSKMSSAERKSALSALSVLVVYRSSFNTDLRLTYFKARYGKFAKAAMAHTDLVKEVKKPTNKKRKTK